MQKHIEITVTGLVQGVFFRSYTIAKANELGITGYVKNMPDGSVLIHASGEDDVLSLFIDWCYTGSPQSRVGNVQVNEIKEGDTFSRFEIR